MKKEKELKKIENPEIEAEIQVVAKDGRISCKSALELANRLEVAPRVIGDAADALQIRITGCQLGCFK